MFGLLHSMAIAKLGDWILISSIVTRSRVYFLIDCIKSIRGWIDGQFKVGTCIWIELGWHQTINITHKSYIKSIPLIIIIIINRASCGRQPLLNILVLVITSTHYHSPLVHFVLHSSPTSKWMGFDLVAIKPIWKLTCAFSEDFFTTLLHFFAIFLLIYLLRLLLMLWWFARWAWVILNHRLWIDGASLVARCLLVVAWKYHWLIIFLFDNKSGWRTLLTAIVAVIRYKIRWWTFQMRSIKIVVIIVISTLWRAVFVTWRTLMVHHLSLVCRTHRLGLGAVTHVTIWALQLAHQNQRVQRAWLFIVW